MSVTSLASRELPLASPSVQFQHIDDVPLEAEFHERLAETGLSPLRATEVSTLQINLGRVCNMACRHCHVDAGPDRRESMSRETLERCIELASLESIHTVDITGGAPELHPDFQWLIAQSCGLGKHVMHRSNLTILELPAYRELPDFLAEHEVELICSLPHYRESFTDRQRGHGTFEKSLSALRRLNDAGYGVGDERRRLVLISNPAGAFLPASQASLEREWKREMERLHGITFDALYTITNMPIARYLEWLIESGNLESYLQRLAESYNPVAAEAVMCRTQISVGWDGTLYDCDFNQMLELGVEDRAPRTVWGFDVEKLKNRRIVVRRHCFGCTAGSGSSCGGATAE